MASLPTEGETSVPPEGRELAEVEALGELLLVLPLLLLPGLLGSLIGRVVQELKETVNGEGSEEYEY